MSRSFYKNIYYFVTVPTFNHYNFFDTKHKKEILLSKILNAKEKFKIDKIDYGINQNHYHLLAFFKNWKVLPKFLQFINGGSSFEINKLENKSGRKIWDEYHLYWLNNYDVLYNIQGYVIGNPYKHNEVQSLNELINYRFSSFSATAKEIGINQAKDMVLKSINLKLNDLKNEIKEFKKHNLD